MDSPNCGEDFGERIGTDRPPFANQGFFCGGRWGLPNNETGMHDYGQMIETIDRVSQKMALYGGMQGIIILVMIFRMLHLLNFQSQVGTVTRTLFKALPDLGEFAFVLVILMVLYASYGMIVAGANVAQYSNLYDSFYSLFIIIVAGDGGGEFLRRLHYLLIILPDVGIQIGIVG